MGRQEESEVGRGGDEEAARCGGEIFDLVILGWTLAR